MSKDQESSLYILAHLEQVFLENSPPLGLRPGAVLLGQTRPPSYGVWITNQLVAEIIGGKLPAGTPIRETELAARFKTSRTPVRDAIHALSRFGFLAADSYRSSFVREFTFADVTALSEARYALDPVVSRLAASRLDESTRNEIVRMIPLFDAVGERGDRHAFFALLCRMTLLRLLACKNPQLVDIYTTIACGTAKLWYESLADGEPLDSKVKRMKVAMNSFLAYADGKDEVEQTHSVLLTWLRLSGGVGIAKDASPYLFREAQARDLVDDRVFTYSPAVASLAHDDRIPLAVE